MIRDYFVRLTIAVSNPIVSLLARIGLLPGLVAYMAKTGTGTDACMKLSALPIKIDFYSPIPDISDLESRDVWNQKSDLAGIKWRPEEQLRLLHRLGNEYSPECNWPRQGISGSQNYFVENDTFGFGCAASTYSMIRDMKPKRVIEVGSGKSSLVISEAVHRNSAEGCTCDYTIVDPYSEVKPTSNPTVTNLIRERVETVDADIFDRLEENDLLFIDSGHTVRVGGDVNFLYLDVIPRLKPGVLIHAHDIHLPNEYPKVYATNPNFRVFWTEAYLLQAFLCLNSEFEVLLGMHYLMHEHEEEFLSAFPQYSEFQDLPKSGSLWMRRLRIGAE